MSEYSDDNVVKKFLEMRPLFSDDYVRALSFYNRSKQKSLTSWQKKDAISKFLYLAKKLI
jgi:hypothetical protein